MDKLAIQEAMERAKFYVDDLTVDSPVNDPVKVVTNENQFFSWDNEHRSPDTKPYLFNWSYYNGVIMEGLYYIYQKTGNKRYLDYATSYIKSMLVTDADGHVSLNPRTAGYVDHHGLDCYKTASLVTLLAENDPQCAQLAADLYRDLTDTNHINSKGNCVAVDFAEASLGGNYWHSWASGNPPKYKVWLDGLYMAQPFLARYAARIGDRAQQEKITRRLLWVAKNMLSPEGLLYHGANSAEDFCPYHWLRSIGWYAMAIVDVLEYLPKDLADQLAPVVRTVADGMLRFQDAESGMWANLVNKPVTDTNRLETSGTVMIIYMLLKGVRLGVLPESYKIAAEKAFTGTVERELDGTHLHDIYLMASANNTNNYEIPDYYKTDEGKGAGPFIMAYSEMIRRQ